MIGKVVRKETNDSRRLEKLREANHRWAKRARDVSKSGERTDSWKRHTFALPRIEAREKARQLLQKYPKAAYWTEVESWRVLDGDIIEFTVRRLPTAD